MWSYDNTSNPLLKHPPGHQLPLPFNTLRPRQNGRHFADDVFKYIFMNENVWISIKISLKFVPKGPFNNSPSLVQIMPWRRPGGKPLSEPMMVSLLTYICVTQWVNTHCRGFLAHDELIHKASTKVRYNIDGLVQDCSISIANALEILQSCTKPSIWLHCSRNFSYGMRW